MTEEELKMTEEECIDSGGHDYGTYGAQKIEGEYKYVCSKCGHTSELGKRCKSGEHCYCDSGVCCWCGLLYPKKWIYHPDDVVRFMNHYIQFSKRVKDVFNMEIERLYNNCNLTDVCFSDWGFEINHREVNGDYYWIQNEDIDFSDKESASIWITYYCKNDQTSMIFPLKVLFNDENYREWIEDEKKLKEQKEKEQKEN